MEVLKRFRSLLVHCSVINRYQIVYRTGSSLARHKRYKENIILRKNRSNPRLEESARKGKLLVPLDDVYNESKLTYTGLKHLQTSASHFNIFNDLFCYTFLPHGYMEVAYKDGCVVYRGNILYPRQVLEPPSVTLPPLTLIKHSFPYMEVEDLLWTLILSNPDGHLTNNELEVLHWMITNIPVNGPPSSGETLFPYIPPVPPLGTGIHRFVFTLYYHTIPLAYHSVNDKSGSWLEQRTFSTSSFLSSHPYISPFTLSFYQTLWDKSVHQIYSSTIGIPEPLYGLEKDPTPRRLTQNAVREARLQRHIYL